MKNKNLFTLLFLISIFSLFANQEEQEGQWPSSIEGASTPNEAPISPITGLSNPVSVYNQAYQENYAKDDVEHIKKAAKNAYVLLDPFDQDLTATVQSLQSQGNQVAAYISIGSGEQWRDDWEEIKPFLVTKQWAQWAGEYFVDQSTTGVLEVMKKRIDKIATWGFDWVEFDNMDWIFDDNYRSTYKFRATAAEGIAYYNALCAYVHSKGMKCMAKNTVKQGASFDGVLYESYANRKNWWDTDETKSFISAEKLVIINHYNENNCDNVYAEYQEKYGMSISYICEDKNEKKYRHYNQN